MPKYAIDTNVYIDSFHSLSAGEELKSFLTTYLPVTYLNAVVMMELRTGARSKESVAALAKGIFGPFERRHRVITPSLQAFKECGRVLALLTQHDGVRLTRAKSSLTSDVLLAASCREHGVTLITRDKDYFRIKLHLKGFQHTAPWPRP